MNLNVEWAFYGIAGGPCTLSPKVWYVAMLCEWRWVDAQTNCCAAVEIMMEHLIIPPYLTIVCISSTLKLHNTAYTSPRISNDLRPCDCHVSAVSSGLGTINNDWNCVAIHAKHTAKVDAFARFDSITLLCFGEHLECIWQLWTILCRCLQRLHFSKRRRLTHSRCLHSNEEVCCVIAVTWCFHIHEYSFTSRALVFLKNRRRYEKGHWDAVIADYKEVELNKDEHMSPLSQSIIQYCKQHLLSHHLDPNKSVLLPCHAIDLKEDGELKAHVDSIRFSGGMVAGLSLLSSSIMRLRDKDHFVDLLLPPLSLYVLTGPSRYEYTHELLSGKNPFQYRDGSLIQVTRDRRVSIIFRDAIHEKEWSLVRWSEEALLSVTFC